MSLMPNASNTHLCHYTDVISCYVNPDNSYPAAKVPFIFVTRLWIFIAIVVCTLDALILEKSAKSILFLRSPLILITTFTFVTTRLVITRGRMRDV